LVINLFAASIAVLTGELPFLTAVERVEVRVEKPRRERRPTPDRRMALPRYGFRGTMRGLK